ncbi:ARM repeat superfamily protein [Wolffia australiana]
MALRSLENAMPAVQERPRKIAKTAAAKPDVPPAGIDENLAPAAISAEASVEYVASADLQPLDDPEKKLQTLLEDLRSNDWLKLCDALNNVRRLVLHHSSLMTPILEKVMIATAKSMKNPRSAVCKTTLMASTDIFSSLGHTLHLDFAQKDGSFDQLLLQLLLKASQDKKFVCEEAEKALREMASCLPPVPLMKKLQSYIKHSNLRVRAKAAIAMACCVAKMEMEVMVEHGLEGILVMATELLNDRLPEARESARAMVREVHRAFLESKDGKDGDEEQPSESSQAWQDFCFSNLRPALAPSVAKIPLQ